MDASPQLNSEGKLNFYLIKLSISYFRGNKELYSARY